jgi:hypothetical protein
MKPPAKVKTSAKAPPPTSEGETTAAPPAKGIGGIPLPSTDPATNFLIADIVLRAAGDLVRELIEKKTLAQTYDRAKAEELVSRQSIAKTVAIYGISRIATRSPAGLAVVAGGLVLKALYDRGRAIEPAGEIRNGTARRPKLPRLGRKG